MIAGEKSGLLQLTSILINDEMIIFFSTMLSAVGTEILCIFVRLNMSDVKLYPSSFNVNSEMKNTCRQKKYKEWK